MSVNVHQITMAASTIGRARTKQVKKKLSGALKWRPNVELRKCIAVLSSALMIVQLIRAILYTLGL
jgi:hypothetical protein